MMTDAAYVYGPPPKPIKPAAAHLSFSSFFFCSLTLQ